MRIKFTHKITFIFILLCFSCKLQEKHSKNQGKKQNGLKQQLTFYSNNKIKESYFINDLGNRDSLYIQFTLKGDTIEKGFYKNDKKHGIWERIDQELTFQAKRIYSYYDSDTLKKEISKLWESNKRKKLSHEKIKFIYKDSTCIINQSWIGIPRKKNAYSKITYIKVNNSLQNTSNYSKSWHLDTDFLQEEMLIVNRRIKWRKLYNTTGQIYKHFTFTDKGKFKTLTVYNDTGEIDQTYYISKTESIFNKEKDENEFFYYDENGKSLDPELFEGMPPL